MQNFDKQNPWNPFEISNPPVNDLSASGQSYEATQHNDRTSPEQISKEHYLQWNINYNGIIFVTILLGILILIVHAVV